MIARGVPAFAWYPTNNAASYDASRSWTIERDRGVPRRSVAASWTSSGIRLSKFQWESAITISVAPPFRQPSMAALPSCVIRCRLCWYASPPFVGSVSNGHRTVDEEDCSQGAERGSGVNGLLRKEGDDDDYNPEQDES